MKKFIQSFEETTFINESYETIDSFVRVKFLLESAYMFKKKVNNKFEIWKGISTNNTPDFFIINTDDHIRKSANTETGYYNLWIDNNEDWQNYPKRSKSIIATTTKKNSYNYSNNVYRLFPLGKIENLKIGICPESDIWQSFHNEIKKIQANLHPNISAIMKEVDTYYKLLSMNKSKPDNYSELLDIISNVDKEKQNIERNRFNILLNYSKDYNIPLLDVFDNLLSPELNDFRLITDYERLQKNIIYNRPHEIWFEHRSLAISEKALEEYKIDELFV